MYEYTSGNGRFVYPPNYIEYYMYIGLGIISLMIYKAMKNK